MMLRGLFEVSGGRSLLALIAFLASAFVFAEELRSYDELMKNTIYGNASTWRSESTTTENDWRAETTKSKLSSDSEQETNYDYNESRETRFNFDSSLEESTLFKVKI